MSSARAVRCRLKCHNERNPCLRLPAGRAGHSAETAAARREEGGDDVKSARPLRPGRHTCYNGGDRRRRPCEGERIRKSRLSSDWSLQPDSTKPDSLVIAHQPRRGEYVPGPCTHRPSSHESLGRLRAVESGLGRDKRLGLSRNKVAVPEGAAGTPPFWSEGFPREAESRMEPFLFCSLLENRRRSVPLGGRRREGSRDPR